MLVLRRTRGLPEHSPELHGHGRGGIVHVQPELSMLVRRTHVRQHVDRGGLRAGCIRLLLRVDHFGMHGKLAGLPERWLRRLQSQHDAVRFGHATADLLGEW